MNSNFIGQKVVKSIPVINDVKTECFLSLSLSYLFALRCLASSNNMKKEMNYVSFILVVLVVAFFLVLLCFVVDRS